MDCGEPEQGKSMSPPHNHREVIPMASERTKQIAALNDQLRCTFDRRLGIVQATASVSASPHRECVFDAVKQYDFATADPGNDPYLERDFGAVTVRGQKYFFKIDYYDANLEYGSEDPSDPNKTRRVLTIMRAEEY
jgi:hypothetical protein